MKFGLLVFGGGVLCFGQSCPVFVPTQGTNTITASASCAEVDTVVTTPVTVRVETNSTELLARMQNGAFLYDQTFNVPFSDPTVQAAITQARAVLSGAGAHSFSGPSQLSSNQSQTGSTTNTITTGTQLTSAIVTSRASVGPQTIFVGALGICQSYVLNGTNAPTLTGCAPGGTPFSIVPGGINIDTLTLQLVTINKTATTKTTFLTTSVYELDGFMQSVPPCTYALSDSGQPVGGRTFTAGSGSGTFTVTATAGCLWSVSGLPSWITSTSSASGSGTVNFSVQANTGAERSGTITIGDQTYKVEQANGLVTNAPRVGTFAHVTSEGTWKFTLVEANLGTAAGFGRVNFANESGGGLVLPLTFPQTAAAVTTAPLLAQTLDRTLNPNAQIVIESTGPDDVPPLIGSSSLQSNDKVTGFGIFSNPTFHWDAVVPLETRNAPSYILAFDNTGALATGVAVSNYGAAAGIAVIIRDDTGAQIGTDTINLPALGHISFMLFQKYAITFGKRGTIEFDTPGFGTQTPGQISVLGLRANGPALTSLPVLANVGTTGGSISHATYNGGFTSTIFVVNTGTSSANFTLSFFDESGAPLPVPLSLPQSGTTTTTSVLTRTLAAGAMLVVDTQANDTLPGVLGSAQLTTTGNISAFEIFRWTTFGQEASVPLETRSPISYALVFDNTNGLTTGVALANVSASTANVTVKIYDDTGTLLQTATIALPGRGHTSFLLPDAARYPIAAGKRGMVEFVVPQGGQISAVGLRAKSDGTLTTIPVLTK